MQNRNVSRSIYLSTSITPNNNDSVETKLPSDSNGNGNVVANETSPPPAHNHAHRPSVFDTVFAPPQQLLGVNAWSWRQGDPKSWNTSGHNPAYGSRNSEGQNHVLPSNGRTSTTLSGASMNYGGLGANMDSSSIGSSGSSFKLNSDGEDKSNFASRGDWWEGSLYY